MTESLLVLKGVTVKFGGFKALDALHLSLKPGELRAVIGPNGAGKSVTFKVLLGIMKADKGEISISGTPISNLPVHERSSKFKIRSND